MLNRLLKGALLVIVVGVFLVGGGWFASKGLQAQPTPMPETPFRIGIMGASGIDEYRADDNRGGAYADVTFNWLELLVRSRNIDAGEWGTWGEPRRTGYAYNWARSGATARTLIESGQHTGLAEQVAAGEIDLIFISVGSNDFAPYRPDYDAIYSGQLAGQTLDARLQGIVDDIALAIDTARDDHEIPVVLTTIPNWSLSPAAQNDPRFADAAGRERVSEAISDVNDRLKTMAEERAGVWIADLEVLGQEIFGQLQGGALPVGGEMIRLLSIGDEPHNGLLGDSIHVGTVLSGKMANFYLTYFNEALDLNIPPMTDEEILASAGL